MSKSSQTIAVSFALALLSACATATTGAPAPRRSHAERSIPPPTSNDSVPGREPTRRERLAFEPLMRVAEQIRDLRFRRPVPLRVQSGRMMASFVREQIDADREELERATVLYRAIGLLDPTVDVRELLVRLMGEQMLGYYDTDRQLMVIREEVARSLGRNSLGRFRMLTQGETVLVHELVHALQDQQLNLAERSERERSVDEDNAFAALVEGDATLAMLGYEALLAGASLSRVTEQPEALRATIAQQTAAPSGAEMGAAPAIVRAPLISRYVDGLLFCATLHGRRGWPEIDHAHRDHEPRSTEDILHPERFLDPRHAPIRVEIGDLPGLEAGGYELVDEETLGELELSVYFARHGPEDRDRSAADGWAGDRLRVYRNGGATAGVWFTVWDDEVQADEAQAAAARGPNPPARIRRGRALAILHDVPQAHRTEVEAAFAHYADGLDGSAADD